MVALSDYEYMRNIRLPNWGRWARQMPDRPNPNLIICRIYRMGRADRQGDGEEAPEPPLPQVNHPDAEWLTSLIGCDDPERMLPAFMRGRLGTEHRHVLCGYFYRRNESYRMRVPGSIRALLDAEYVAIELGWKAA